jgi:hypothetical protein
MRIRGSLFVLILLGLVVSVTTAFAGEPFGRLSASLRTPTPYYVGNPKLIPPKKETPFRAARYSSEQSTGPHAYPYGYFGAQTRPYATKHSGYYNDFSQTSYGRGY